MVQSLSGPGAARTPERVIRLSERGYDGDGTFQVQVRFGDADRYDVEVTDPSGDAAESELEWYFEQHFRYPFLDQDREQQAVRQIASYGETLFEQTFGGSARRSYEEIRGQSFDGWRLEVGGSLGLQRLHWEALRDPALDSPLAVRLPIVRRADAGDSAYLAPEPRPTLNILLVTARPGGVGDIGYRTISRPLLDAIQPTDLPVVVDLVRPGTWTALQDQLRSASRRHGPGWYQVIHFDLHGMLSEYGPLEAGRLTGQLVFSSGPPGPFEGRRGFLLFETDRQGSGEPVSAQSIAALLAENGIPIAVMNACQSAMQSASEASVAQRLAEAGVQVTVGMAYSVTVSAAVQAVPVLYGHLAGGADPGTALLAARRQLHQERSRQAYFSQRVDLEDWMLPVIFVQRPVQFQLRGMTADERARFSQRGVDLGNEPATEYGFLGRDLDVHAIERQLLASPDANELLVQGMAGAGKSALLAHLSWWWQRTGLIERAFSFSYEDRAWTSGQIVRGIQSALFGPEEKAQAEAMPDAAQQEQLVRRLRGTRYLLILDNMESITAAPGSMPHTLGPSEQERLKALLGQLRGGRTLVLIGSREPEPWLTADQGGPGRYWLRGLDPQAASALVERVLQRHDAAQYLGDQAERSALQDLVTLLEGNPLPLTVVVPAVAVTPPSAVLAELRAGGPAADPAGLIYSAIAYSYGKLDAAAQRSLLLLSPFTSVIPSGPILEMYRDNLLRNGSPSDLGSMDLAGALSQAADLGLAAPDARLALMHIHPSLPYFLRSRLPDWPDARTASDQAHYELYLEMGASLSNRLNSYASLQEQVISETVSEAQYANLTTALHYGLNTRQPVSQLIKAIRAYLDRTWQHNVAQRLVAEAITAYPEPASLEAKRELAELHGAAGATALAQHRLEDAQAHRETELGLWQVVGDQEAMGVAHYELGVAIHLQGRLAEAESHYRTALDIFLAADQKGGAANTFNQLGRLFSEQRRFAEAEDSLRKSVDLYLESGGDSGAAAAYVGLGVLASTQRQQAAAAAHYHKALVLCLKSGDQYGAATAHHNLGVLAESQGQIAAAETHFHQALDTYLAIDDRLGAATTFGQLGNLAKDQQRFAEAETNYHRALEAFLESGDRQRAAVTFGQLADTAQDQQRYAEADANFHKALELYVELDDQHSAAGIYHGLGVLERAQKQFADAEANFRRALELSLALGDQHQAAGSYHMLGMLAQDRRQYQEAEPRYRQALALYRETGDERTASITATQLAIVLAQLRRHGEAIRVLLNAAVTWHREVGQWSPGDLQWLHYERKFIQPSEFRALVQAEVPDSLSGELSALIQVVPDPDEFREVGEPEAGEAEEAGASPSGPPQASGQDDEGNVLHNLGLALQEAGRYSEAVSAHRAAAARHRQAGDRHAEANALNNLSVALQHAGQFEEAVTASEQAAIRYQETGDLKGAGDAWNNLGAALQEGGQSEQAIRAGQQAVDCYREAGLPHREGMALRNLGLTLDRAQRFAEAVPVYERAAARYRETGDQHGEADVLQSLGLSLIQADRPGDAIPVCRQAATRYQQSGDRQGEGDALRNLGLALLSAGQPVEALPVCQEAVARYREHTDPGGRGQALTYLAIALLRAERAAEAVPVCEEAVTCYREVGDRFRESLALDNLAVALQAAGRRNEAAAARRAAAEYRKSHSP